MRFLTTLVAVLALAVFTALPVQAKTLGDYLPKLLGQHERAKAAIDREGAAQFSLKSSKAAWYPRLDLSGDFSREDIDQSNEVQRTVMQERNIEKLRATQLLYDWGLADSIISQNKARFAQASLSKGDISQALLLDGAASYLDLYRFKHTLDYAIKAENSVKQRWDIESSRVDRGAGLKTDELQAKAQLAMATASRVGMAGQYDNAKNHFKAVFSEMPEDADVDSFSLPPFPANLLPATEDEAVQMALGENLTLKVIQAEIEFSKKAVESVQARFLPAFNLYGEHQRKENDGGKGTIKIEQRLGVEFNWNLLAGGGDLAALEAAKLTHSAAINDLADNRRNVEEAVRRSWTDLRTATDVAEWFRNQANIQGEFLDLARKQRDQQGPDQQILSDLLNAEVGYYQALSGSVSAEVDKYLAAYRLLYSLSRVSVDNILQ